MGDYIHYGSNAYDLEKVRRPGCAIHSKPDIGLWGSDIDAKRPWREWCLDEDYNTESLNSYFEFEVHGRAKILHVRKFGDLLPYLVKANPIDMMTWGPILNRRKLYEEYDGMEIHFSEMNQTERRILNVYDCDCICVWNPERIIPIGKGSII